MKTNFNHKYRLIAAKYFFAAVLVAGLVFSAGSSDVAAVVDSTYLYTLSDFSGPVPYNQANLFVDQEKDEIYVVDPRERDVAIFDRNGMEIYRFGNDGTLGTIVDIAVKENGNILVLSKGHATSSIIECNFRGEPLSELKLKNLPADFSDFSAKRMAFRQGRLYLLDSSLMKIVVTDAAGFFEKGYDLAVLLSVAEKKRRDTEIGGFSLDREGNILFTVPTLFAAYSLSPDGKITGFGKPGSAPGGFSIISGIAADDQGNYYVADSLKSVVLIFDKDFQFKMEFGYRGLKPENLIGPKNLVVDSDGRLYVSQLKNRGISVFKIDYR